MVDNIKESNLKKYEENKNRIMKNEIGLIWGNENRLNYERRKSGKI